MSEASVTGAPSSATAPEPEGLSSQAVHLQRLPQRPAGPPLMDPSVVLAPSLAGLFVAVCRECPWHSAPSTRTEAAMQSAEHRNAHRHGLFPAPFRVWSTA